MDKIINFFAEKESLTLIGVIFTFLFSIYSFIRTSKLTNNGYYIKEITGLRAKYIESLRKQVAEFGSHALECSRVQHGDNNIKVLLRNVDLSYSLIKLHLNEENPIDKKLALLLDKVRNAAIYPGEEIMMYNITELLEYTQKVLLFEWKNLKYEAKGKPLSDSQIEERRKNFIIKYEEIDKPL